MPKWSWRVEELLTEQLEMVARNTVRDLAEQTQKKYQETLELWWKPFITWKRGRVRSKKAKRVGHGFGFLLKASDHYHWGTSFAAEQFRAGGMHSRYGYRSGIIVDPDYMDVTLKQRWGDNKGVFPNDDAFNLMYRQGVYGFNEEIVSKCWYDGIQTTGVKAIRDAIIDSGMVPPTVPEHLRPYRLMKTHFYDIIGTKRNIKKTMMPYMRQMRNNLERIGNK
jgi:hypothetical protein